MESNPTGLHNIFAFIKAAAQTCPMRHFKFMALGTFYQTRLIDLSPFRPALVFTGMTLTSFGNTHLGTSFLF
jgi:hypothetical protein